MEEKIIYAWDILTKEAKSKLTGQEFVNLVKSIVTEYEFMLKHLNSDQLRHFVHHCERFGITDYDGRLNELKEFIQIGTI